MTAARGQLTALAEVGRALDAARLGYWLFGGWAVDFYCGRVTRAHDDIDIAVWLDDVPRIAELLREDGWEHVPSEHDNGGTGFERGHVRLELTYLVRGDDGSVYIPLRDGRATWPADAFGDDVLELGGTRARAVSLPALVETKSTPRDDPDDAPKDRADYDALRGIGWTGLRPSSAASTPSPGGREPPRVRPRSGSGPARGSLGRGS